MLKVSIGKPGPITSRPAHGQLGPDGPTRPILKIPGQAGLWPVFWARRSDPVGLWPVFRARRSDWAGIRLAEDKFWPCLCFGHGGPGSGLIYAA